ncbi:hypothetical protein EJB05_21646, partial [Eragrostis curvula]
MDVQVERTFVIPPSSSESEEVPFTVFDFVAKPSHMTVLYAFSAPNPTNEALLAALTAVLPSFPLLAARIDRDPVTDRPFFVTGAGGGAGVLVKEATVAGTALADHLPLCPSDQLVARLHVPRGEGNRHMLKVQVNRFAACGGVVIAPSAHHQAADGPSMRTFLQAWVDAVRAGPGAPPPPGISAPYGPSNLTPRCPPLCEFEHRGAEFLPFPPSPASDKEDSSSGSDIDDHQQQLPQEQQEKPSSDSDELHVDPSEISNMLLHYTKEFIAELKAKAGGKYTTFETLSAHVWKKITAARGLLDAATPTSIYVAVNGRWRVPDSDAIPRDFFGNAILAASSETTARDLVGGGLADAAAMVRAAARAVDERYLLSFIDFGAVNAGENLEPAVLDEDNLLSPDVDVNSWLHLGLHTLDFGCGGKLVGSCRPRSSWKGRCTSCPASARKEASTCSSRSGRSTPPSSKLLLTPWIN